MTREDYISLFRQECYCPAASALLDQVLTSYTVQANIIQKELSDQFSTFFYFLSLLQEKGILEEIHTISISFPYTSLLLSEPYLLFEVYPRMPFVEDPIISRTFPVSWMFPNWDEFFPSLIDKVKKNAIASFVRPPFVRSYTWGTVRTILRMASTLVKLHLRDMERHASFQSMNLAESFQITFGEYMDWQRILMAYPSSIDIFHCEDDASFCFQRFHSNWYEQKDFGGLNLNDCTFDSCTFKSCSFFETQFKDTRFLGCNFEDCTFEYTHLEGALFEGVKFLQAKMLGIYTNCMTTNAPSDLAAYMQTDFTGCFFQKVEFQQSDFSASRFRGCHLQDVISVDNTLSNDLELLIQTISGGDNA